MISNVNYDLVWGIIIGIAICFVPIVAMAVCFVVRDNKEDDKNKEVNKMTNADRIRGMTTDEMVEEIFSSELIKDCKNDYDYRKCWVDWLNQEVEED